MQVEYYRFGITMRKSPVMNPTADRDPGAVTPSTYYAFALLFLLYMFDYIDRLVIVSLFPFLKRDWGLTDAQCGLLVSAVYWSILIFSLPVSILIDRWSRKKSIGLMALFWGAASLGCAFTRNFSQLICARTAIGIGEAGYAPGGTAMISAMFPQQSRARMLGIWNASIPLGSALGIVLGGFIAEHFGWRHAFGIVALPGMIAALFFFYVKDYQTIALVHTKRQESGQSRIQMKLIDIVRQFTKNRTLVFNNLAFAANAFVTTSLLTWLPTYYHRIEMLPMDKAATKGGSIMLLALVGAPLGGFLADKWLKRRKCPIAFSGPFFFSHRGCPFGCLYNSTGPCSIRDIALYRYHRHCFCPGRGGGNPGRGPPRPAGRILEFVRNRPASFGKRFGPACNRYFIRRLWS